MGALGVDLIAAIKVTSVDSPLFGIRRLGPPRATYAVDTEGRHGAARGRGHERQLEKHCGKLLLSLLLLLLLLLIEFETMRFQITNQASQQQRYHHACGFSLAV